ncbi:MAG: MaoC family dehydratase [Alcaligenaceae bacterium]|nr:MAG: MaoC family dehydratase [Alcaligenaceae bacterium]
MIDIKSLNELKTLVGRDLGASPWTTLSQEMIDDFARATGDHQWIHTEPEAASRGPFESTIAHGFLILSMMSAKVAEVYVFKNMEYGLNYGCNRVRFVQPVKSGESIRMLPKITSIASKESGLLVASEVRVEASEGTRTVCYAELLSLVRWA